MQTIEYENRTGMKSYYYNRYTDSCIIRSIISGKLTNWTSDFTEIMKWPTIYDYVNEQIKQVPTTETLLISDLIEVKIQLKSYENQVLNVYTGF